jgi:serine/threonine-protein kinase RsbW
MSFTVTEQTTELILPSRIESVAEAAEAAAKFVSRSGLGEEIAYGVDMAVREAVTNAVLHGNKQELEKTVELTLMNSASALEITVRDHGTGFDPGSVPDPTVPQNLMKTNGRGILFMRTFMDEVQWLRHDEGGTVVRMIKRH